MVKAFFSTLTIHCMIIQRQIFWQKKRYVSTASRICRFQELYMTGSLRKRMLWQRSGSEENVRQCIIV